MSTCLSKIYNHEPLLIITTEILLVFLSFTQQCDTAMQTGSSRSHLKCMLPFTYISVQGCPSFVLCALRFSSTSPSLLLSAMKTLLCRWPITRVIRPKPRGNAVPVAYLKACCQTWSISKPFVCQSFPTELTPPFLQIKAPTSTQSIPTPNLSNPTYTHRSFCHSEEMSM